MDDKCNNHIAWLKHKCHICSEYPICEHWLKLNYQAIKPKKKKGDK